MLHKKAVRRNLIALLQDQSVRRVSELLSYDKETELGYGGSSTVFAGTWYARDSSVGEPVAVKKMNKRAATGEERREVEVRMADSVFLRVTCGVV